MGVWGYGPFDSDSALDWVGDTFGAVEARAREALGSKDYEVVRAAVEVFLDTHERFSLTWDEVIAWATEALDRLRGILADRDYVNPEHIREPDEYVAAVNAQIERLVALQAEVRKQKAALGSGSSG